MAKFYTLNPHEDVGSQLTRMTLDAARNEFDTAKRFYRRVRDSGRDTTIAKQRLSDARNRLRSARAMARGKSTGGMGG